MYSSKNQIKEIVQNFFSTIKFQNEQIVNCIYVDNKTLYTATFVRN